MLEITKEIPNWFLEIAKPHPLFTRDHTSNAFAMLAYKPKHIDVSIKWNITEYSVELGLARASSWTVTCKEKRNNITGLKKEFVVYNESEDFIYILLPQTLKTGNFYLF